MFSRNEEKRSGVSMDLATGVVSTINSEAGVRMFGEDALGIPAFFGGFKLIAEAVAELPPKVFDAEGKQLDTPEWMARPNLLNTGADLLMEIMWSLVYHGNAYVVHTKRNGSIEEMGVLSPWDVSVNDAQPLRPVYYYNGAEFELGIGSGFSHIRFMPKPGQVKSWSMVDINRESLAAMKAAQLHTSNYFANSAMPSIVLTTPMHADVEQARLASRNLKEVASADNKFGIVTLPEGFEPKTLAPSNDAAQLIQTRNFLTQEVCRMFSIPASIMSLTEGSTNYGTGYTAQLRAFGTQAVHPWVRRIEQMFSDLVRETGEGVSVQFDMNELTRGSFAERVETLAKGIQGTILTPNEGRFLLGYEPSSDAGADSIFTPTYLGTLDHHDQDLAGKIEIEKVKKETPDE